MLCVRRRRKTCCALESGGQTCALQISTVEAVYAIISVGGAQNQLAGESLRRIRELVMSYAVGGVSRTEVVEYVIEGRVPFAVSARGVRVKLGVSRQDLAGGEIELVGA